eukprot:CAMPEP_0195108512 /NCGR_PEP_ID=MMETSP0448-20130528/85431_1 /TAXON_ID=66468 /ORGANISM="Heterocapsa triquestra, Strain CCMP 448" /LENGTH=52 /DNA_ID=CAMNT_0040145045 /DNA_START=128 /DNA_END=283 /DNA_ORIENTATION=-
MPGTSTYASPGRRCEMPGEGTFDSVVYMLHAAGSCGQTTAGDAGPRTYHDLR